MKERNTSLRWCIIYFLWFGNPTRYEGFQFGNTALETPFRPSFSPSYITLRVSLPQKRCAKPWQQHLSLRYAAAFRYTARLATVYRKFEAMPSLEPRLHLTGRARLCHSCTRELRSQRPTDRNGPRRLWRVPAAMPNCATGRAGSKGLPSTVDRQL